MISVIEADKILKEELVYSETEETTLELSYGKVLREVIKADREQPPFDRVAMDGIGIKYEAFEQGLRYFSIQDIQRAGSPSLTLKNSDFCIEVMTGAVLPEGCDCVIKVEDITVENHIATLKDDLVLEKFQNIHKRGSDHPADIVLIEEGISILPTHIAVAASVGKSTLKVNKIPSIAIISTGDELVPVTSEVKPYQIRMSNSHSINSALLAKGYNKNKIFHLVDDQKVLAEKLADILATFDILILSGGVSMGKFDFIPSILGDLGVKEIFHKIKQKPGKPMWFGKSKNKQPIFALPGNPVSSIICFYRYVMPYLNEATGIKNLLTSEVILTEDCKVKGMTAFLPVKIENSNGVLKATTVKNNGSGDYYSLVHSDGFIELQGEKEFYPKDSNVKFYSWKV
jgi:molybdopterin molybdotransferase